MAAIGQGGGNGGGTAAAGGTGPASTGAPAGGAQAPGGAADDPFGFQAALQGVPEANRPLIQPVLDGLAPQLQERLGRYAPLDPHLEALTPLLEADEQGNTPLTGLTNLYDMFGKAADPNDETGALDQLTDWWESVGESFDLFDDDEGTGTPADPAAAGTPDLSQLDPNTQAIVSQLQQQNEALQARLDAIEQSGQETQQQQEANRIAQEIRDTLSSEMKANGIDGADNLQSEQALDILRLAQSYGADEDTADAIKKGTAKYMELRGLKPPAPAVDPTLDGVAALQAAIGGGAQPQPRQQTTSPALANGSPDTSIPAVTSWADATAIAKQRMAAAQQG